MFGKKSFTKLITSLLVLFGIFVAGETLAMELPSGSLVKAAGNPSVYYLSENGTKHQFTNAQTYHTWYSNFRKVKNVNQADLNLIKSGKKVTVHPGLALVKFPNSTKVYAVETGATLRWITSEQAAKSLYGYNWVKRIIILPNSDQENYSFGKNIVDSTDYQRNQNVIDAKTIDLELKNIENKTKVKVIKKIEKDVKSTYAKSYGVIKEKQVIKDNKVYEPSLNYLNTGLSNNINPNFHPNYTYYRVNAKAEESKLKLSLSAQDPKAKISVNGLEFINGTSTYYPLNFGRNKIAIKITTRQGKTRTYNLIVTREILENNNLLSSLNENILDELSPAFAPGETYYKLRAASHEQSIDIKANTSDNKAKVSINGNEVRSGWNYNLYLEPGLNIANITVTAENGSEKKYKLEIYKSRFANADALDLDQLETSLNKELRPNFDPDRLKYYIKAKSNDERIDIYARAKKNYAYVYINGQKTEHKSIRLFYGKNNVEVMVELDSGEKKVYKLEIERPL